MRGKFTIMAALIVAMGPTAAADDAREIAITIDDLPFNGYSGELTLAEKEEAFHAVLAALERHDVRAMGFVNAVGLRNENEAWLDAFVAAGHTLGNHTFSHPDLNRTSIARYAADIDRGGRAIARWLPEVQYFRFPFLHRGDTLEKREAIAAHLRANVYTVVPVSIDNDEYLYNVQAVDAHDTKESGDVKAAYITHMMERSEHFDALAQEKLGRSVKHVLLIHMNYLNGLYLDALLQAYADRGWRFISPQDAIEDLAYALPDAYIGPKGLSYLERIDAQPKP